jgi:hypothetical protein
VVDGDGQGVVLCGQDKSMFKLSGKIFLGLALATGIVLSSAKSVAARPAVTQVGVVEGLVYQADNSALSGANVTVDCNSNSLGTTTDANGFYFVQFGSGVCEAGATATVTATKGGESGSATGTLNNQGTFGFLKLDVAIVNVLAVPEFSTVTGLISLVTSSGAFVFLRRRFA